MRTITTHSIDGALVESHGRRYGIEAFREPRAILEAQEETFMSQHLSISPAEAADRLAIRELVEAFAHCADRRDAKGQMALFTADTHFVVYMDAKDPKPSQELRYADTFVKNDGAWLFSERLLYVDWIEQRALS
ncbi:MAG: nuclear transport factor 2 family protein [Gemmatimonadales bacterium]